MRKDVKIGLAIAGVLFAVLIVYVFTPKGDTQHDEVAVNEGEQLTDDSGQPIPTTDVPPVDPAAPQESIAVNPGDAFAPGETTTPTPADPGSAAADAGNAAGGSTDWLKTFDTGVVSLEHPPLVAQTETPAPGAPPAVPAVGAAVTDDHHGPSDATAPPTVPSVTPDAIADAGTAASPSTETSFVPSPAAPAPITPASSGGARTHVIQRGESFSTIAKAVYGNSKYYLQIAKANPELDPTRLKPDTEIKLPDISAAAPASEASANTASARIPGNTGRSQPAVNAATEYRIQPGDSLYKISVKLYGNGAHVDELYETNAATIGDDPGRLKVGTVLKLHDAPRVAGSR